MAETKYHVEISTVGGDTCTYDNCSYTIQSDKRFEVCTSDSRLITFLGNYTVEIMSMEDYRRPIHD